MQSFCDSNRIYLNSMYAGSSMNNAFEKNFFDKMYPSFYINIMVALNRLTIYFKYDSDVY